MTMVRRMLLAGAMVAVGCGTTGVSSDQVARLPAQDRAQIVNAERSINVAKSNESTAKLALDEAKQFQKISQKELEAARTHLEAARTGIKLGRTARDQQMVKLANQREEAARNQMLASQSKVAYANRLVDLRQAQVDEAEAAVKASKSNVELTKVRLLQNEGIPPEASVAKLREKDEKAQNKLADSRSQVASLQGDVQSLKQAWTQHAKSNTASLGQLPPLHAPPAPRLLPPEQQGAPKTNQ